MTATVKTIAEQADVSVGTVSRVLNNHENVNAELRDRVLRVAAELGYVRVGKHEVSFQPRKLRVIVFLFHPHTYQHSAPMDPCWSYILHGVEAEARKRHIRVTYRGLAGPNQEGAAEICEELARNDDHGALLVGPAPLPLLQTFQRSGAPLVMVDHYVPHQGADAVLSDNVEGARAAVEHLIEAGHRQIAFIGGPTDWKPGPVNTIYTIEQRAVGYRSALVAAGLPFDQCLVEASMLTLESGYQAAKRLLERDVRFTGLFCANDHAAIGAIKALSERGLRVPDDVSVVGFDDIDIVQHLTPALTTVRVHKEEMGRLAALRLIERTNDPSLVRATLTIDIDFIRRGTVAAPKVCASQRE